MFLWIGERLDDDWNDNWDSWDGWNGILIVGKDM